MQFFTFKHATDFLVGFIVTFDATYNSVDPNPPSFRHMNAPANSDYHGTVSAYLTALRCWNG